MINKARLALAVAASILAAVLSANSVSAAPYGRGVYNEDIPYGSETSLSIATDGNTIIQLSPTDSGTLGTNDSDVTVTSTDVVGYKLYVRADGNSNLINGAATIAASGNVSAASLSPNTWGYNNDGGANFIGMTTSDSLVATRPGPYTGGDITTFTYGVQIDNSKPAGNYTTTIIYTAVPQTD